jgi:hypothetical protein
LAYPIGKSANGSVPPSGDLGNLFQRFAKQYPSSNLVPHELAVNWKEDGKTTITEKR